MAAIFAEAEVFEGILLNEHPCYLRAWDTLHRNSINTFHRLLERLPDLISPYQS